MIGKIVSNQYAVSAVLAMIFGLPAAATEQPGILLALKPAGAAFEALDTNSDGKITRDEINTIDKLLAEFSRLDKNKDGALSKEEFSAYDPAAPSRT